MSWLLSSLLSDPSAFKAFSLVIGETEEKTLMPNLLAKLREQAAVSNSNSTEPSQVPLEESKELSFAVYTKDSQYANVSTEIGFSNWEGNGVFASVGDLTEGPKFLSALRDGIINPYAKWKQIHMPDTKEYSTRVVILVNHS